MTPAQRQDAERKTDKSITRARRRREVLAAIRCELGVFETAAEIEQQIRNWEAVREVTERKPVSERTRVEQLQEENRERAGFWAKVHQKAESG